MRYVHDTELLINAIELVNRSLQDYVSGNKQEVEKIEKAIAEVESQLVVHVENSSPIEILDYLSKVVELKLKVEELKVKKGTSVLNILKSWAPVLVPLLVGLLTFAGVVTGIKIQEQSNARSKLNEQIVYEQQLLLEAVKDKSTEEAARKLHALIKADIFQHSKDKAESLVRELQPKSQTKQDKPNNAN